MQWRVYEKCERICHSRWSRIDFRTITDGRFAFWAHLCGRSVNKWKHIVFEEAEKWKKRLRERLRISKKLKPYNWSVKKQRGMHVWVRRSSLASLPCKIQIKIRACLKWNFVIRLFHLWDQQSFPRLLRDTLKTPTLFSVRLEVGSDLIFSFLNGSIDASFVNVLPWAENVAGYSPFLLTKVRSQSFHSYVNR